ncbi:Cof-type HAD-IIB family hydrolase [Chitinophaga sancti]|uniref:Cof-type HAD-IIB family hydrolase n=1 Tax=Chitinophaga sancti TaxID=1004 RepID=UPI003F7A953C
MDKATTVKAVFFDIDGTLFSAKTKSIPASTIRALEYLRARGIRVFIATGRSINAISHVQHLNFDGYITFNGGCCVAKDNSVLFKQALDPQDIQQLLHYTSHQPLNFSLMYEDCHFVNQATPEIIAMYAYLNLPVPPLVDRTNPDVCNILQANILLKQEDELEFMHNIMPNSIATRWAPHSADINPKGISKKVGVEVFCEHFGFHISETMSFGDGGNDIEMLRHTAIGVAMGNATADVKAVADYVTDDIDNDGIWKALLYFKI